MRTGPLSIGATSKTVRQLLYRDICIDDQPVRGVLLEPGDFATCRTEAPTTLHFALLFQYACRGLGHRLRAVLAVIPVASAINRTTLLSRIRVATVIEGR